MEPYPAQEAIKSAFKGLVKKYGKRVGRLILPSTTPSAMSQFEAACQRLCSLRKQCLKMMQKDRNELTDVDRRICHDTTLMDFFYYGEFAQISILNLTTVIAAAGGCWCCWCLLYSPSLQHYSTNQCCTTAPTTHPTLSTPHRWQVIC